MKIVYIIVLICISLFCSGCSGEMNKNLSTATEVSTIQFEASDETVENVLLSTKLNELNGTLLVSFNYGNGIDVILAAIAYGTAPSVEIWRFTDNMEELVMQFHGMLSNVYGMHSENGINSLVICNYSQGLANPATILSMIDGEVVVFSEYKGDTDSTDLLWYCNKNGADLICRKGNGISMGSYNIIPYYLDVSDNKYKPYDLTKISVDEAKALDKNSVITDMDKVVSAYKRDNGLVHINYDNVTEADFGEEHIASRTFVAENGCLRPYEDGDIKYGFFLQALTVTE